MVSKINKATNSATRAGSQPTTPEDISTIVSGVVEAEVRKIKLELNDYKAKIIEVLAIFVALFTFVSVDIQVFKTDISTLSAMGFTLVMLGALLLFILVLAYLFDEEKSKDKLIRYSLFITSIAFIVIGIFAVGYEHQSVENKLKNNFYTKDEINKISPSALDVEKQVGILKACLKAGGWNSCL